MGLETGGGQKSINQPNEMAGTDIEPLAGSVDNDIEPILCPSAFRTQPREQTQFIRPDFLGHTIELTLDTPLSFDRAGRAMTDRHDLRVYTPLDG